MKNLTLDEGKKLYGFKVILEWYDKKGNMIPYKFTGGGFQFTRNKDGSFRVSGACLKAAEKIKIN
jgi:hypothetical protein